MKVLFLDKVHPALEDFLLTERVECHHDYTNGYEALKPILADYDGVVIRSRVPFDSGLIDAANNLKFIARSGAGLENIDVAYAEKKGIAVLNSPEGNRDAVGEHAIGMLLSFFNNLSRADSEVRQGIWRREENRGIELAGKTVGIIGYGHTGSAFAKKLQGFDCKILAFDKYKKEYAPSYVNEVSLDELKATADVISIHLPLSAETDYFINDGFIAEAKKPFFLINTARGRHVQTSALLKGLASGKVRGACLDVLEYEKKSFEKLSFDELPADFRKLAESKKVILSPHIAGWTVESYFKLSDVLSGKVRAKILSSG
jgi:D-3-phosphoglycerate dehydrogenase